MDQSLVATLAAAVGFTAKTVWDWFYARRREWESLVLSKRVEVLDLQLSQFYWPLYIRLEKNDVIWRRILDVGEPDESRRRLAEEIENGVILPNHAEITAIIETRMHLAEADADFRRVLLHYIHHVTLHRALRAAGDTHTFPMEYGIEWPQQLFPMVRRRTEALQHEYDSLIGRQDRAHSECLRAFASAFEVQSDPAQARAIQV
jgi:hypothetical protein